MWGGGGQVWWKAGNSEVRGDGGILGSHPNISFLSKLTFSIFVGRPGHLFFSNCIFQCYSANFHHLKFLHYRTMLHSSGSLILGHGRAWNWLVWTQWFREFCW